MKHSSGHTLVKAPPDYPGKKYYRNYIYEHTLVYWRHTGCLPAYREAVHHKNNIGIDNRFENLQLVSVSEHARIHNIGKPSPLKKSLVHGTINGYQKHKCRCDACRRENARINIKYKPKYRRLHRLK